MKEGGCINVANQGYLRAKQLTGRQIPPWQKIMDSVQNSGAGAFVPGSMEELQDIPKIAGSVAADYATVPFTDFGPRKFMNVPEPQTEYGQNIKFAADVAPLVVGGVQAAKGIDNLIRGMETGKVQKIQQAFGPWVKKYTNEYGQKFRGGVKEVLKGAKTEKALEKSVGSGPSLTRKGEGLIKEVKRAFNPLRRSDAYQDLPNKTQKAIEKVYSGDMKPRDVLNAANRLRKSPMHSKLDETGALAREATKKLKNIVKKESPEFSRVDREYGEFSGVKNVMQKFRPDLKGQGQYGTAQGTRILRNINKREPGEIEAMSRFGKETGTNIVDSAKFASMARGVSKFLERALPIGAGIGGGGYLFGKKFLSNGNNNPTY